MTEPTTELEQLKNLQKQSQKLTRKREESLHDTTDTSAERNVETTIQNPGIEGSPWS